MIKKPSVMDRALLAAAAAVPPQAPASGFPAPVGTAKPKTGPGALVAHMAKESEVMRENTQLREELKTWSDAVPTRQMDPNRIRPSRWANRHTDSFLGPDFSDLKAEIQAAGGNVQPIKVRPLQSGGDYDYEIVFGHRRHEACRQLGVPVLALVESVDDKVLFVEMDRENRQRADLRPYEQGVMYARALDEGLFSSLRQLAAEVGVKASNASVAIKIARLPKEVLEAFPSRLDIQFRWAGPLADAVEKDPKGVRARAAAVAEARQAGLKCDAAEVFKRLTEEVPTLKASPSSRIVKLDAKTKLKITESKDRVSFELDRRSLSVSRVDAIERAIIAAFQG